MTGKRIIPVQDSEDYVSIEVLASKIIMMSNGLEEMRKSPLNDRALVVLLADSTGVSKTTIKDVLQGIVNLKKDFLNVTELTKIGN